MVNPGCTEVENSKEVPQVGPSEDMSNVFLIILFSFRQKLGTNLVMISALTSSNINVFLYYSTHMSCE